MKTSYFFINLFLFFSLEAFSQSGNFEMGARSFGIGDANTTISDEWSMLNNVGGISGVEQNVIFFSYLSQYQIEGLSKKAAGTILVNDWGNIGLAAHRFGDQYYSEQQISGAFGNKVGFIRLGVRVNYFQIKIQDYGHKGSVTFDLGGIVELMPKLSFGAYISNITQAQIIREENEYLPVVMKAGISYSPTKSVYINLDIYKDVDYASVIKAGVEYQIVKNLFLRTGFNTKPLLAFYGIGICLGRFKIDYGLNSGHYLGGSHQVTVSCQMNKAK